ncbi:hypothetical protein OGATHE_002101 [Ogataea polymorpha]|uniref:Uncharacterized protein n=1 Tax=Ogataea polymorpha TaxID=460523 RepID=A0A9P8TDB3_9ASCO|nr:hypothetical protein OGATHE_002101 [Ogataea polymorpha]
MSLTAESRSITLVTVFLRSLTSNLCVTFENVTNLFLAMKQAAVAAPSPLGLGSSAPTISLGKSISNCSVLANRYNEIFSWVEEYTGNVIGVSSAAVNFPGSGLAHSPKLNDSVVTSRNNQGKRWVERGPVDTLVMAFEHVLYNGIRVPKDVLLGHLISGVLFFEGAHSTLWSRVLLSQSGDVPNSDRLIQRSRNDQILGGMKLC